MTTSSAAPGRWRLYLLWLALIVIAIALGIANSMGAAGFARLAERNHWRAEDTLRAYVGDNAHRQRRRDAIDAHFPVGH